MKKSFLLLFALLCASVMTFAIDWSGYGWIGDGAGGGAYSNKYKVAPVEGQSVVNIQQPGWASEPGIYTNGFGGAISSCSLGDKCAIDGAGIVLYLSAFTAQETEVTIVAAQGSKTFTVYYVDGTTPITSEYCNYQDPQTVKGGKNIALTWETNPSGDVVITMTNGTGATSCSFRNGGFEGGIGAFIVSTDNFVTSEAASNYFTATQVYSGNTYTLTKTADLPANAKIKHVGSGHALAWVLNGNNEYCFPDFIYTYGGTCNQFDAPTNVAVAADSTITFDAVSGAEKYTAYVYLNGALKYDQEVTNGGVLHFFPLKTATYQVNVIASADGKTDSDPSADVDWTLTKRDITLGNSEYCEHVFGTGNDQAAITWVTNNEGAVVITLTEILGGEEGDTHFRNPGMNFSKFKVGYGREDASVYFNHACSNGTTVTLTLIDPANAPAIGEKIYFDGYVEYNTSKHTGMWPSVQFEYTYGSECSGIAVSATPNNNAMGTAVVKQGDDEVTAVESGTSVTFIATPADANLHRFVNWTKGGVEVSTEATYVTTITETTNLIANFEYILHTYCHTAVQTSGNKKVYLTVGKGATDGTYQIKIYGSDELTITGINNANTAINHVKYLTYDGNDVPLTIANGGWTYSSEGYGVITSAELRPQTNHTWRDMWMWRPDLFMGTSAGEQVINSILDNEHYFNWDNDCADADAPAFTKAEAEILNESSVRLKIQATDNWEGILTYTIARAGAEPIISNHASGEEFAQEVTGLTTGTEYDFTVTVSDGVNNANTHILVTPVGDETKPVMGEASLDSKTWNRAIINVAATDNKGVTAYYVVEKDADYVASEGKITVEGLTASTEYTLHIKAKDAAGNVSDNQASVNFTTDAHSLVPTTAAPVPTWPASQVKSIYSDTYELAPAHTPNYNAPWWNAPAINLSDIDGDHFMDYNLANDGMIGWQYDQISVATMEKLHIDIYASAAGTVSVRPITDGDGALNNNRKTLTLVAQQWKSFDIDLTEFGAHDWTKLFQFSIEYWAAGGLLGEHISVDNVYFYRTTELVDNEKPTNVSANVAKASFGSITLNVSGEDNSGTVLYSIKIEDTEYANGAAASGASKQFTLSGLTQGTNYSISVIASDESGNIADPVIVAAQTNAITPAPVPTHNAALVRSVYCDAYETALAHNFLKNTWTGIPYSELDLGGDHVLAYTNPNMPNQMPDIAWGVNNDGADAIIAKDGFNEGTNKGLDVRHMQYIHFDIWSSVATIYPELRLNDTPAGSIVLDGSGWQSFDLDITSLTDAQKSNIRWIKFIAFRDPAPEDIVIDNVYFYEAPDHARTGLTIGGIGTICLPYAVTAEDRRGGTFYRADYQGPGFVYFLEETGTLKAGQAYIFVAEKEAIRLWYSGSEVLTPLDGTEARGFYGTFTDMAAGNLEGKYVIANGKLRRCGAGATLSANRAYIDLDEMPDTPLVVNDPANAPVRRRLGVGGNNGAATDLENVFQLNAEGTQKLILNGQLYILRDGHLYNAQGQVIK